MGPLTLVVTVKTPGVPVVGSITPLIVCWVEPANDEVRDVLVEDVDRQIGVLLVIPFRAEVDIVRHKGHQVGIAASGHQRTHALAGAARSEPD